MKYLTIKPIKIKQKTRLIIFLVVLISATIKSCKKSEDDNKPKTKTELLTSGNWMYTSCIVSPAYDYYGDGNPVTDIYSIMKSCEKDDFETFKANGIWEYNQGATKCDQSDPQILISEPWSFIANETKVLVGTTQCTILELTSTTLKLQYEFEDSGVTYTEVDTISSLSI